jgi:hypothetical protein
VHEGHTAGATEMFEAALYILLRVGDISSTLVVILST